MPSLPVILDMDPGYDDAVALTLALGAPELDVRAVTTVAGNVSLEKTTRNALMVLSLLGRDVPVGAGAAGPLRRSLVIAGRVHGESGLGGLDLPGPVAEPDGRGAVGLMTDVIGGSPEPVTLVPTGPLTNVATFLREHPRLKEKVSRVVLMGGSIGPGNVTPAAEFNIYVDPEAAREVFESGLPITMAGLDVTREATAGPEEIEDLRSSGRVGKIVAGLATFYAGTYEKIYGQKAPPIHDIVAVAAAIEPSMLETRRMWVDVECEGELTRGETVCDVNGVTAREPNAEVGVALDKQRLFELLYRSLRSL